MYTHSCTLIHLRISCNFQDFSNLFVSEGLSAGLIQSWTVTFLRQSLVLQQVSDFKFSLIVRSVGLVFFLLQASSFLFKHTRFLARDLGCYNPSGQKDWSQSLCQILFWWPFVFACQNYIFVTIYFSCFPKLLIDTFLKIVFLIFWSLLPKLSFLLIVKSISKHIFVVEFSSILCCQLAKCFLPIFKS